MREFLNGHLTDICQITKYAAAGISGAVIQVAFLYLFVDIFGVWYLYGVVLAFFVALVVVFSLQKFWTFKDYSMDRIHKQSTYYIIIAIGSLVANIVFMYILVDFFAVWHILAQSVVVLGVGFVSFLVNKKVTFSPPTSPSDAV